MKTPINIPGTASNGKSVKDTIMGAADTAKAKFGTKEKAEPINIKTPEPAAAPVEEDMLTMRQMLADMGIHIPSWKRTLVMAAASFLSGYVIGATFNALFNYMFGAAILASGWTFMTVIAYVIGLVIAIYAAIKVAGRVANYIGTGTIDHDAKSAWGWIKGKCGASNLGLKTV